MAVYKEDIVDIDLAGGNLYRSFLKHTIGTADSKADHFGVRVFRGTDAVDLTGVSVQGFFRDPQGNNIAITSGNSVSGNVAYVVLPQACYNYEGQFCLAIKLVGGGVTGTMRIVDGVVDNTNTGSSVAPTSTVPTYQEVLAQYDAMVAATAAANGAIAATYSSSSTYKVGDYCIHDGGLYRCTTAITTAEAWTSGHWTAAKIGPDVSDLKSALKQSNNELFRISGYLNQNYVKGRQRYVDAGVEKFANNSRWISPAQGEYIELKSGDMIVTHQSRYHFRVCYSTDNKATWTMTGEQTTRFAMPSDAIAWIPIIATTTATDEDVETILNEHVIEIIRNGVNLVGSTNANVNGIMDALNISPNSGFQIEAIKDGTTFVYVNTTATENGGTEKLFEIPCAKDDVFRIKFDFQATILPENFADYYLVVREINEDESSPLRNVLYKLSELQTAADFTVYYANTKKIIANVSLKRSDTTVPSSYDERILYTITVIKVLEQNDDVYTEAGEAWEV